MYKCIYNVQTNEMLGLQCVTQIVTMATDCILAYGAPIVTLLVHHVHTSKISSQ